jgi:hypothetical protein
MSKRITDAQIDSYYVHLHEPSRPPSRGGDTRALHQHVIHIAGERYSFMALGSQRWVFKTDRVSFDYEINGRYRNILKKTLVTVDANGKSVVRGNRGFKRQLRTALARLPGSRREQSN